MSRTVRDLREAGSGFDAAARRLSRVLVARAERDTLRGDSKQARQLRLVALGYSLTDAIWQTREVQS